MASQIWIDLRDYLRLLELLCETQMLVRQTDGDMSEVLKNLRDAKDILFENVEKESA